MVRALLDRSFSLIGDCVSNCDDCDVVLADVQECQTTLALGATAAEIESVSMACLDSCRDFLATANSSESERRQSMADLMGLIQGAVKDMSGKTSISGADLAGVTRGFDAVLKIDDLAAVKAGLAEALAEFKRASGALRDEFTQTMAGYQQQISELETTIVRNEREATMDALTGLINRGTFDRTVKGLVEMPDARFAMAILDVDRLKTVNEAHGHLAGDRALLTIAQVLKSSVRETDLVARYGDDEFAVLMRDCPVRRAEQVICNAAAVIMQARLTADDGRAVQFTLTGALAELAEGDTMRTISKRIHDTLEAAKRSGCNRVVSSRPHAHSRPGMPSRLRH